VIAVADAGPLMALAKIDSLDLLSRLYSQVYLTPGVYAEAVTAGYAVNAADADVIERAITRGQLHQRAPTSLIRPAGVPLHSGERESLALVLEIQADVLLIDDLSARRMAENILAAAGALTRIQGTLGVVVSAYREHLLTREQALERVSNLRARPDIWLNVELCDRVLAVLRSL
jgi:predicted nucleic acid-binding protein